MAPADGIEEGDEEDGVGCESVKKRDEPDRGECPCVPGVIAWDAEIVWSPHRLVMTISRYSLGTTIVPSPALSMRASS
jgi:hypothetical protein